MNGVKSATRTLEILEYFDQIRGPANVVTLAKALGFPQSSAAALLKSMTSVGYLAFDPQRRTYAPTDRVALLGSWVSPALFGMGPLLQMIEAVADRSGLAVLLGARNGDHVQYIHVADLHHVLPYPIRTGRLRRLTDSGLGMVLLSTLGDLEIRNLLRRMNAYREKGVGAIDVAELQKVLHTVRRLGHFTAVDRFVPGTSLLATLLPTNCNSRLLALGIAGPTEEILQRRHALTAIMRDEMNSRFAIRGMTGDFAAASGRLLRGAFDRADGGVARPC